MAVADLKFDFRLLGTLEVGGKSDLMLPAGEGAREPRLAPKAKALLAILLLRVDEAWSVNQLIDALYGDAPPRTAKGGIQTYISDIRKILGAAGSAARIESTDAAYRLALETAQVDLQLFDSLVKEGRDELANGRYAVAADKLAAAEGLWRGPAFAGIEGVEFLDQERERLEGLRVQAVEDRIDADLACGKHAELIPELERLSREHPFRERLHAQLMLALYRAGRQAEALAQYRDAQGLLDDIGIEPGAELRQLQRQILAQDPALSVPESLKVAPSEEASPANGHAADQSSIDAKVRAPARPDMRGRESELQFLLDRVAEEQSVVVHGPPGIGKTTVLQALHAAHPEGVFVRLEQGGAPMRDLRLALHRRTGGEFPVDDDVGIALLSRAFADGVLMLIDNADEPESAQAIRRLTDLLPNITVVVTSRAQPFPQFEVHELQPLAREDAEALLLDVQLAPPMREVVLDRGGGNPLVIRQAAWAAVEGHEVDDEDRLGAVLRRIEAAEQRALWLIGELPSATLPRGLLTEVGRLSSRSLELLRRNAVAKPQGDAYEFHETLRSACRGILDTVTQADRSQLQVDATAYYSEWLAAEPTLAAIDRAFPDLMHLLRTVPEPERKIDLALALIGDRLDDPVGYIPSRGFAGLFREDRKLLAASASAVGGVKAAKLEKNLGLFCHWGEDASAEELVLSARSRFRDAGDEEGRAGATWVLGIIADDSCDYARAEAFYREPLQWLHDPETRAFGHHLTGCCLYHQGRYDEAQESFAKARESSDDPVLLSRINRRLAYVELINGDADAAVDALVTLRQRSEELNRPRDVARIDRHLGEARLRSLDPDAAASAFATARETFEVVGDRRGLGASLLGLAAAHRLKGDLDEARQLVRMSREIACGGEHTPTGRVVSPIGLARAEEEEARTFAAAGDQQAAIVHLRHACNVYEVLGHARADALATELGEQRDAPLPRPAGILFDVADTLAETSDTAYENAKRRISSELGVDHDRFKAVWARSRRQASIDASWSPRDRIEWVANELDVDAPDETLDALAAAERELWTSAVHLKPDAVEGLERLRAAGVKIALVSNGTSAMQGLPEALGLASIVDATIVSSSAGVLKPHPGIYQRALDQLKLKASDCIYVGDGSDRELEGAKAVGIFAVRMLAHQKPAYSTKHSLNWDATVHSVSELADRLGL